MKNYVLLILLVFPAFVSAADDFAAMTRAFCIGCHGPEKQKGDFRVDQLAALDATDWETI